MKILIIRPAALGDTLMLAPAIMAMRGLAEVVLVGRNPGLALLKPYLHHIIDFESSGWHHLFTQGPDLVRKPSIPPVEQAVVFLKDPHQGMVQNNLRDWLPGASIHLFEGYPSEGEKNHVALYLAKCLHAAGAPIDPEKAIEEALVRPLLRDGPASDVEGKILFHPGSGGRQKNHPSDFWVKLIGLFIDRLLPGGKKGLLLLGPAEENDLFLYKERLDPARIEILCSPETEELARRIQEAPLYVGHDSGVTHLSAMLGTPTLALFRKSSVAQWRPLGPCVSVIEQSEGDARLIGKALQAAEALLEGVADWAS